MAEKFQTGFDQPLLHTMYVDKPLVGLAAVQTLSRLNRIHPLKENTFVLDFRNDTEDIVKAFEQFHGCTVAPPTDPNILWDTRRRLDDFDVLRPEEIEAAMPALLGGRSDEKRSAATYAALGPGKARFEEMDDEQRLEFRDALTRFVRTYSFVSQIAAFTDPALERDYIYCRALSLYLRDTGTVERLDLGTEVELTHLRHQMTFSGTLSLTSEVGEVRSFFGEGKGGQQELDMEHLSSIVELLNERFGTDLTDVDKLLFDQFEETLGRRRGTIGSGPEQQHRELPPGLRPQVPPDDRHADGRQQRDLQADSGRRRVPGATGRLLRQEGVRAAT